MPSLDAIDDGAPCAIIPSVHEAGGSGENCGHAPASRVTQCTLGIWHSIPPAAARYFGGPTTTSPSLQNPGGNGDNCGQPLESFVTQCCLALVHSKPLPALANSVSVTSVPSAQNAGGVQAFASLVTQ